MDSNMMTNEYDTTRDLEKTQADISVDETMRKNTAATFSMKSKYILGAVTLLTLLIGSLVIIASSPSPPVNPAAAQQLASRPSNGFCEKAQGPLHVGVPVKGTSISEKPRDVIISPAEDALNDQTSKNFWFTVMGTGTKLVASTKNSDTDCKVKVFKGSCRDLVNVNDKAKGQVSWTSRKGEVYFISVSASHGDFHLVVSEHTTVRNVATKTRRLDEKEEVPQSYDTCLTALGPLALGASVTGSTAGVPVGAAPACGEATTQESGGAWYSIVAERNSTLYASTCGEEYWPDGSFDRQVSVFRGNCENLECLAGAASDPFVSCHGAAGVSWPAVAGETFYILVHGRTFSSSGNYTLNVGEVPSNDLCEHATPITTGVAVAGSTQYASNDGAAECGSATDQSSGGLWYKITPKLGQAYYVTTCTGEADELSTFDAQISVFRGSCESLECVDGNDDKVGSDSDCSSVDPGIAFAATSAEPVLILVHGRFSQSNGVFHLLVTETTPVPTISPVTLPSYDMCSNAGILSLGDSVAGSTVEASEDNAVACGQATEQVEGGVWYFFTATYNSTVFASTCADDFLQVSVYRGDCDNLECVTGDDHDPSSSCAGGATAQWAAVEGEVYYVLVHGWAGWSGSFVLDLGSIPPNDKCQHSKTIELDTIYEGTTIFGEIDGAKQCGDATEQRSAGVWYSYTSEDDGILFASTCTGDWTHDVDFDSQISVFRGSCDSLKCINGNNDDLSDSCNGEAGVSWEASGGATYYILVHGAFTSSAGKFYLVLRRATAEPTRAPIMPPPNDSCEDAIGPLSIGDLINGSTEAALFGQAPACGGASAQVGRGVWFTLVAEKNTTVILSTCSDDFLPGGGFSRQVSVYRGDCDSLQCIAGDDTDPFASCSGEAGVSFPAVANETVLVLIHSEYSFSAGPFVLSVSEAAQNDFCINASPMLTNSVVQGDTGFASSDGMPECGGATTQRSNGVWYKLSSLVAGQTYIATTCPSDPSQPATFATQISLFRGSCGSLECVDGKYSSSRYYCYSDGDIIWTAEPDEEYYLLIYGRYSWENGKFSLSVSETTPAPTGAPIMAPPNDSCEDAIGPLSKGDVVEGSTLGGVFGYAPSCGSASAQIARGAWYYLEPENNETLIISTCGESYFSDGSFNRQVSVYTGDCESLACVAGDDTDPFASCHGEAGVSFSAVANQTYLVIVHGEYTSSEGKFTLSIGSAPSNNLCTEAALLPPNTVVKGTTDLASNDEAAECGFATQQRANGVWYELQDPVPGQTYLATTCTGNPDEESTFDTQISIFHGNCETLECVAGNDDSRASLCYSDAGVLFTAPGNDTIYILVHGAYSSSIGSFHLMVSETTAEPTSAPVAAPINDLCTSAIGPLSIGDSIDGSTIGSSSDNAARCGGASSQVAGGVYYYFTSEINGTVYASTCGDEYSPVNNFDRQISVYRGECDALECVAGDDSDPYASCSGEAGVSWVAIQGETYYLLIHGNYFYSIGDFVLRLGLEPPNDLCENATPLLENTVVEGTTLFASNDFASACGRASSQSSPGVFYSVTVESDQTLRATTCTSSGDTILDSQISVFRGTCGALECLVGSDDDTGDFCYGDAGVVFTATAGETLYLLVHGEYSYSTGSFFLELSETTPEPTRAPVVPPPNDLCTNAIGPLSVGDSIAGTTDGAANDNAFSCGGASSQVSPGVWFFHKAEKSGNLYVSTCGEERYPEIYFDRQVSVFRGSCDNLECVSGSSSDSFASCSGSAGTSWYALEDELYFILLHGEYGYSSGTFVLNFGEEPSNDLCSDAIALDVESTVKGSTLFSSNDYVAECGDSSWESGGGVWYTHTVSTETERRALFATTCTGNVDHDTSFESVISVFRGSCGSLQCVAQSVDNPNDACSTKGGVAWSVEAGETYYISVHGRYSWLAGDFFLVVRETTPVPTAAPSGIPENDLCESATGPLPIGSIVEGSTLAATMETETIVACGEATEQTSAGVFYTVVGTGATLKVSTCTGTTNLDDGFDSQISVFHGSCVAFTCVAGNDNDKTDASCSISSSAIFDSIEGELYYILVHGRSEQKGWFLLTVRETPINDFCSNAVSLEISFVMKGTTQGASEDGALSCGFESDQTSNGVWYKILGNGEYFHATTCMEGRTTPDFDSQLTIYDGECSRLSCVAGNDDDFGSLCGSDAAVLWKTELNTTYFILVHGHGQHSGPFSLVVEETTSAPTIAPTATSPNDLCEDAIGPLELGNTIDGWMGGATNDFVDSCGGASTQYGPGVWYSIVGVSNTTMFASTCTGRSVRGDSDEGAEGHTDTQISVYRGSCDALQCIDGNDDDAISSCYYGTASVQWNAVAGEVYLLLVHSFNVGGGQFSLVVDNSTANDVCEDATLLSLDTVVKGSTFRSTNDKVLGCGDASDQQSSGVFYTVEGTGGTMFVTTCTETDLDVGFDSQIAVFSGSCSDLECIDGNDDYFGGACNDGSSGVSWESIAGELYYIAVYGFGSTSLGEFGIIVREGSPSYSIFPSGSLYPTGTPYPTGTSYPTVPTETSSPSTYPPHLASGSYHPSSGSAYPTRSTFPSGSFYPTTGPYPTVPAGTSQPAPHPPHSTSGSFPPSTGSAYPTGSTHPTTTTASSQPARPPLSFTSSPYPTGSFYSTGSSVPTAASPYPTVSTTGLPPSRLPTEHPVYLPSAAPSPAPSSFPTKIVISDEPLPSVCDESPLRLSIGETVEASTEGAVHHFVESCGDAFVQSAPGKWFLTKGDGSPLIASTCTNFQTKNVLDTQVSVFEGECDSLQCVGGNADTETESCDLASSVRWISVPGRMYWILVHGHDNEVGPFGLRIRSANNNRCFNADGPLPLGTTLEDSTVGAVAQRIGACGSAGAQVNPGRWYVLHGTGNQISVSTCTDLVSTFNPQITILKGPCNARRCVAGSDASSPASGSPCGSKSSVTWNSVVGETYRIMVHGRGTTTPVGSYTLSVVEQGV